MAWIRTLGGMLIAALVVASLFLGGPILGMMGAGIPTFTLDEIEERKAVYYFEEPEAVAETEGIDVELPTAPPDPEAEVAEIPQPGGEVEQGGEGAQPAEVSPPPKVRKRRPAPEYRVSEEAKRAAAERKRRWEERRRRRCKPELGPYIVKGDNGVRTVRRALIREYSQDWGRLNKLGWTKTHTDDAGRPDGMRIGGVRCNNDLHQAGFRSGDVLHKVNGHEVTNLVQALIVYTKVRRDRDLRVEITRRGKRRVLRYHIQG